MVVGCVVAREYLLQLAPSLLSACCGWPFSCAAEGPSAVLTTFSRRPARTVKNLISALVI